MLILNNVAKKSAQINGMLAKKTQNACLQFKSVKKNVEKAKHVGKCV